MRVLFLLFFLCLTVSLSAQTGRGDSLRTIANDFSIARSYDRAKVYYEQSAQAFLEEDRLKDHFLDRIKIAFQMNYLGQQDEAQAMVEGLLSEAQNNTSLSAINADLSAVLFEGNRTIGFINDTRGKLPEALTYFEKALTYLGDTSTVEGKQELGQLANSMGITYAKSGIYTKAQTQLELALNMFIASNVQSPRLAAVMNNLGNLADLTGVTNEAMRYYQAALDVNLELLGDPDNPRFATYYKNIGSLYARMGLHNKALEYYNKAISLFQKIGNVNANYFLAETLTAMGNVYEKIDEFDTAERLKLDALNVSIQTFGENHPSTTDALFALGSLYLEQSEPEKALVYHERNNRTLRAIYQTDYEQYQGWNYNFMGKTKISLGRIEEGLADMRYSLKILDSLFQGSGVVLAEVAYNMGVEFLTLDQPDSAMKYYQLSLKANSLDFSSNNYLENPSIENLLNGRLYFVSLVDKAYAFEKSFKQTGDREDLEAALNAVLLAMEYSTELNKDPTIIKDQLVFKELISSMNMVGIRVCYALYQEEPDRKYLNYAFLLSELNKSSLLLSNISQNLISYETGLAEEFLIQEENLNSKIAYLESKIFELNAGGRAADPELTEYYESELFDLRQKYDQFLIELRNKEPLYYNIKYDINSIGLTEVQEELLVEDQVMLSYHVDEHDFVYVFTITSNEVTLDKLPGKDLSGIGERYSNYLSNPAASAAERAQFEQDRLAMSEILIPEALGNTDFRHLIIIADDVLNLIPFDLFSIPGKALADGGKWYDNTILAQHDVSYANSATLLSYLNKSAAPAQDQMVLALAPSYEQEANEGPVSERSELAPLIWTAQEVENVKKYFNANVFLGQNASEARFKDDSPRHSIVHIASHALLDERDPFLSKLVMAQNVTDSINDGTLNTREILGLSIPAEMIVLSACNTGVGDIVTGEGVISLANSFFYAGSQSLVMTLWTANDESSTFIMDQFYKNLAAGKRKSEALRLAKLAFLETADDIRSHPYYWAHFIVNGNDSPIVRGGLAWYYWLLIALLASMAYGIISRKRRTENR